MKSICIIGRGFLGEHFCKYFTEKYPKEEVIYYTDDFNFNIINEKNYKIMNISNLEMIKTLDYLINTICDFDLILRLQSFCKKINFVHYHQVMIKRNNKIEELLNQFPCDITISQPCHLYGPGQFAKELIPSWIFLALKNKTIVIKKNYERNWLFITDYCHAVDLILKKGKNADWSIISTNVNIRDTEIISIILKTLNRDEGLLIIKGNEIYKQTIESTNLSLIGWEPRHTLDKALLLTIKWYILDNLGERMKEVIQLTTKYN